MIKPNLIPATCRDRRGRWQAVEPEEDLWPCTWIDEENGKPRMCQWSADWFAHKGKDEIVLACHYHATLLLARGDCLHPISVQDVACCESVGGAA